MDDPVSTVDGHTYERASIVSWFVEREEDEDWMDPPTWDWMGKRDAPLAEPTLTDNLALRHAIEGWSFQLDMAMRDETIRRDELTPVTSKPPHRPSDSFNNTTLIGKGSFKEVHRAEYAAPGSDAPQVVAVLKVQAGDVAEEAKVLLQVGRQQHPYLVRFLGISNDGMDEQLLIMEFAPLGDVRSLIINLGETEEGLAIPFMHKLYMLQQVASGMCALAAEGLFHRDLVRLEHFIFFQKKNGGCEGGSCIIILQNALLLFLFISLLLQMAALAFLKPKKKVISGAAQSFFFLVDTIFIITQFLPTKAIRNLLVFGFDMTDISKTLVKVSDFGLAVNACTATYMYVQNEAAKPIRYLAPEALKKARYSEKSDVWAFGVMAWELIKDGDKPYFEIIRDEDVIAYVLGGERLPRPTSDECPADGLWAAVASCWAEKKTSRPTFANLMATLSSGAELAAAQAAVAAAQRAREVSARQISEWQRAAGQVGMLQKTASEEKEAREASEKAVKDARQTIASMEEKMKADIAAAEQREQARQVAYKYMAEEETEARLAAEAAVIREQDAASAARAAADRAAWEAEDRVAAAQEAAAAAKAAADRIAQEAEERTAAAQSEIERAERDRTAHAEWVKSEQLRIAAKDKSLRSSAFAAATLHAAREAAAAVKAEVEKQAQCKREAHQRIAAAQWFETERVRALRRQQVHVRLQRMFPHLSCEEIELQIGMETELSMNMDYFDSSTKTEEQNVSQSAFRSVLP